MGPGLVHGLDSLARTVGLFLLRETLYSAVILAAIFPLSLILKKRPAWQFALWGLVFLRLILPPGLSQPYSLRNLFWPALGEKAVFDQNGQAGPSFDQAYTGETTGRPLGPWMVWPTVLFCLWAGGMAILLIRHVGQARKFSSLAERAEPILDGEAFVALEAWRRRFSVRRTVKLRSGRFPFPFTVGLIQPIIYLPRSVAEAGSPETIEAVIAHEMAHVKNADVLWVHGQNILRIIYFFNPVAWLAGRRLSLARECLCDHMVLSHTRFSAETYGNSLMAVLRTQLQDPGRSSWVPGLGSRRRHLRARIRLMKGKYRMKEHPFLVLALVLALLGPLILPLAGSKNPQPGTKAEQGSISRVSEPGPSAFVNPVPEGKLTSAFGERLDPLTGKLSLHKGLDLAAPKGTPVLAAAAGRVIKAVTETHSDNPYGLTIVLQHAGGYTSFYTKLDAVLVKIGQEVAGGEVIGKVGETGIALGPHLHLEIHLNNTPLDPALLIYRMK